MAGGKRMEQLAWLGAERGIGHGHANALVAVHRAEGDVQLSE